jgi:hypothetical protein
LSESDRSGTMLAVEEALIYREEVRTNLLAFFDMLDELRRIRRLLEDGEEEEDLEE